MEREHIKTSCPRDCYDGCGIVVVKREGRVTRVLGDPDHPVARGALCGKCALAYNGVWRDPEARLSQPLKRVGAKGEGRWQAVSWDEALGEIAERLNAIRAEFGGAAIFNAHYTGTCSLLAGGFPQRFFDVVGATEIEPDTICNNAGHVALGYVMGTSGWGFDPRTARDSACVLVWGANPSASAPHAHKHWLAEVPGKVVVVDPIRHPTAEAADLHLQVRPGTDAALAFALLHVLWRDGKLDRTFLAAKTLGWEEIEPLLADCTPAWGEAQTGVSAADIEQAAAWFAAGPALTWLGQGLQRQPLGGNIFRAVALLPAATGNFGKPGAGLYYLNGSGDRQVAAEPAQSLGDGARPSISHMDLVERLEDPAQARAFVSWNMNPAASGPRQAALRQALAREDLFNVVIDLFETDTGRLADFLLPAASFLEFDDLNQSYFHINVQAQTKVEEPPGEALPNQEIFRRLAKAMGLNEPALFETDREMLERALAQSAFDVDFATLQTLPGLWLGDRPLVTYADGGFPTPSGKLELASAQAEADGHPRVPQPAVDAALAEGWLRLLSPASPWMMNDSYANEPRIKDKVEPLQVTLHPADAEALGIVEGQAIRLESSIDRMEAVAQVAELAPRGTLYGVKGHWGWNLNRLNPGTKTDMGESSAVHSVAVKVTGL
ncbi:MAG: molybdopterin oxidoreductase family protein [Rhodospirillales bacterium]